MAVSYTWLANANVSIQTTVVQAPSLNRCMIVGVFPAISVGATPVAFGRYKKYMSYASFSSDFSPIAAAETDATQIKRYTYLDNAVSDFFDQLNGSAFDVLVGRIDPTEILNAKTNANALNVPFLELKKSPDSWYGFTIADNPCPPEGEVKPDVSCYQEYSLARGNALSAMAGSNYKALYFEDINSSFAFYNTTYSPPTLTPNIAGSIAEDISSTAKTVQLALPLNVVPTNDQFNVLIDSEVMTLTENVASNYNIVARGVFNTTAAEHKKNATVEVLYSTLATAITPTATSIALVNTKYKFVKFPASNGYIAIKKADGTIGEIISYASISVSAGANFESWTLSGIQRGQLGTTAATTNWPLYSFVYNVVPSANSSIPYNPADQVRQVYNGRNWLMCYHSQNFNTLSFASSLMGSYFLAPKGKTISSVKLKIPADSLTVEQLQSLTDKFINSFTGFSASGSSEGATGLVQYGHIVTSTKDTIYYVDQIYTADYAEVNVEANLATEIMNNQPYYDDAGIQQLVAVVKRTLDAMAADNMIFPLTNKSVTYISYAEYAAANPSDITNRIYKGMAANIIFKSHIQQLQLNIKLSLV